MKIGIVVHPFFFFFVYKGGQKAQKQKKNKTRIDSSLTRPAISSRIVEVTNCGSAFWLKLKRSLASFQTKQKAKLGKCRKTQKNVHTFFFWQGKKKRAYITHKDFVFLKFHLQLRQKKKKNPSLAFILQQNLLSKKFIHLLIKDPHSKENELTQKI